MPHQIFGDVECDDLTSRSNSGLSKVNMTNATITTLHATTLDISAATIDTLHTTTQVTTDLNVDTMHVNTITASHVDFKEGPLLRAFTTPLTKDDIGATGVLAETFINFPTKVKLINLGFMSAASDVIWATGDTVNVQTEAGGTVLGTLIGAADYTLGSGEATSAPLETATWLATNRAIVFEVATAGVSGSVYYFVDYRPRQA